MRILSRMRRQRAVYWAPTGVGDDGEATYAKPIELRVRWEGVKSLLRSDPLYKDNQSREVVYVPQVLTVGGVLWKGKLSDCPSAKKVSPYQPFAGDELSREISRVGEYPTLSARQFLRVAVL